MTLAQWLTVLGLGVALAMDAVAVGIAASMGQRDLHARDAWRMAGVYGGFQTLMPLIGGWLGALAGVFAQQWGPWIAFALLTIIGGRMLWETWHRGEDDAATATNPFLWRGLLITGIATSIDAMAAGVTLPLQGLPIVSASLVIGVVTTALVVLAVLLGQRLGSRWADRADWIGGSVLIALGVKNLIW